jgi:DNA modification methylase
MSGRRFVGYEIDPAYVALARRRLQATVEIRDEVMK